MNGNEMRRMKVGQVTGVGMFYVSRRGYSANTYTLIDAQTGATLYAGTAAQVSVALRRAQGGAP